MIRLREACEQVKRGLSASAKDFIELDALYQGARFKPTIARTTYENLCSDLLAKLLRPVKRVLRDVMLTKSMVDEVVAVGGLAHMPKIRQLLSHFDGKPLSKLIRPDEATITGITVQTAILINELPSKVNNIVLLDVISLSLGVEIDGKQSAVMIPRNTPLPSKKTRTFSVFEGKQPMRIQVVEAKRYLFDNVVTHLERDWHVLDEFHVPGNANSQSGIPSVSAIEISFDVDVNGILQVSVMKESTGELKQVTVESGCLPPLQIERMTDNVKKCRDIGAHNKLRAESKTALKNYADSMRYSTAKRITELKRSIELTQSVERKATDTLHWLDSNRSANKEEFDAKRQKLEEEVNTIGVQSNNTGGIT